MRSDRAEKGNETLNGITKLRRQKHRLELFDLQAAEWFGTTFIDVWALAVAETIVFVEREARPTENSL